MRERSLQLRHYVSPSIYLCYLSPRHPVLVSVSDPQAVRMPGMLVHSLPIARKDGARSSLCDIWSLPQTLTINARRNLVADERLEGRVLVFEPIAALCTFC